MPVVARLVVRTHEPGKRIVQSRFVNVDEWHRNASAGSRPAIGLPDVGPARFLESLDLADDVRQPGFREDIRNVATAFLEHAEYVARPHRLPRRHG